MSLGAYEIFEASGDLPEPVWPDYSFEEILKIAFRDRIVDRPDHPLVQRLQGAVVAMAELMACRRTTDPVGGDTACQHVVAHTRSVRARSHPSLRLLNTRPMQVLPCLTPARAVRRQVDGQRLTFFLSEKFGRSISSSAASRARTPSRCAWLHGNCAAVASCGYGAMSSAPRLRTRPAPTHCSSPITPAQKSVAISLLAGQCQSACWTCSPSSAITLTAFPRSAARACLARLPTMAWTASAPSRKTKCAT